MLLLVGEEGGGGERERERERERGGDKNGELQGLLPTSFRDDNSAILIG